MTDVEFIQLLIQKTLKKGFICHAVEDIIGWKVNEAPQWHNLSRQVQKILRHVYKHRTGEELPKRVHLAFDEHLAWFCDSDDNKVNMSARMNALQLTLNHFVNVES